MGLWNPTLREVREGWATLFRSGVGLQRVPHRAFGPVRNDKILWGLAALRSRGLPGRGAFQVLRGMGLWNPTLRGIPPFAKCAKDGPPSFVVVSAYSGFLAGLSARFGMTKFYAGLRHY
jgi:hypothetical protein